MCDPFATVCGLSAPPTNALAVKDPTFPSRGHGARSVCPERTTSGCGGARLVILKNIERRASCSSARVSHAMHGDTGSSIDDSSADHPSLSALADFRDARKSDEYFIPKRLLLGLVTVNNEHAQCRGDASDEKVVCRWPLSVSSEAGCMSLYTRSPTTGTLHPTVTSAMTRVPSLGRPSSPRASTLLKNGTRREEPTLTC